MSMTCGIMTVLVLCKVWVPGTTDFRRDHVHLVANDRVALVSFVGCQGMLSINIVFAHLNGRFAFARELVARCNYSGNHMYR